MMLNTRQVADFLGVNSATVTGWVRAGKLHATQIPGRGRNGFEYRFNAGDLEAFKQQRHAIVSEMWQDITAELASIVADEGCTPDFRLAAAKHLQEMSRIDQGLRDIDRELGTQIPNEHMINRALQIIEKNS
jgi:excisionase family DNA binding protein